MALDRLTLQEIVDPGVCSLDDALRRAKALAAEDQWLPERLAECLRGLATWECGSMDRIMSILECIAGGPRLLKLLEVPMVSNDSRVRSKAWKIYARATLDPEWAANHLEQSDARVAANILEAMWRAEASESLRQLFAKATESPSNRVAGNGAIGLFLLDDPRFSQIAEVMAGSQEPIRRATAAWLIGRCRWKDGVPLLIRLSRDSEPRVRQNAVQAMRRLVRRWPELRAAG